MGNIEKFNNIANQYDTPERAKIAKIIANEVSSYVIEGKQKTLIDFGCGTGLVGINLVSVFYSVIFIDASYNMVEQVKHKIQKLSIKNANALYYNLMEEDKLDLKADYILISQTLLHIKDIQTVLSNLYTMLNKNGHLIIVDFNKNENIISDEVHNGFEQEKLINILHNIGLKNITAKTFYHGNKLFMNKEASLFILDSIRLN